MAVQSESRPIRVIVVESKQRRFGFQSEESFWALLGSAGSKSKALVGSFPGRAGGDQPYPRTLTHWLTDAEPLVLRARA